MAFGSWPSAFDLPLTFDLCLLTFSVLLYRPGNVLADDGVGRRRLVGRIFDECGGRLLTRFKALQDAGHLEILTCCATHGYLPLMVHEEARRAQIAVAVDDYKGRFGRAPRGIWMAECAYAPGVDRLLKDHGLFFTFMDAHGVLFARPRPRFGVFAPIYAPAGVAFFGRDMETAQQVWSAEQGYPGDYNYREFYRDVGYDLDYNYIKPYLHEDGVRRQGHPGDAAGIDLATAAGPSPASGSSATR